jgi:hypothetical protein
VNVIATQQKMDWSKLGSLTLLCLRHPLYIIPSYRATRKTVSVCDDNFGKTHHKNGKANAFRHALWNALLIQYCRKWFPSAMRAKAWAKRITDWHEDFSPNSELARAMDYHNNRVGREFAMQHLDVGTRQMVQLIMVLIPLSRKHTTIKTNSLNVKTLVYNEEN